MYDEDQSAGPSMIAKGSAIYPRTLAQVRRRSRLDRYAACAAEAERVLRLAEYLPDADRAVLRASLRDGLKPAAIAALRRESVISVRRRLVRLTERVKGPEFVLCATQSCSWPSLRARAARLCIIEGVTLRAAAARLGTTVHAVRYEVTAVRMMAEALSLARRLPELPAGEPERRSA